MTSTVPGFRRISTYVDGEDPIPALRAALRAAGLGGSGTLVVGVEDASASPTSTSSGKPPPRVRPARAPSVFDRLRAVKDAYELECLTVPRRRTTRARSARSR